MRHRFRRFAKRVGGFLSRRFSLSPEKHSLRRRLFSFLLVLFALMLSLLWIMQVVFLDDFYSSIKIRHIEEASEMLKASLHQGDPQEVAEMLAQRREICIIIYKVDDNGWLVNLEPVASMDILGSCVIHHVGNMGIVDFYDKAVDNQGVYQERLEHQNSLDKEHGEIINYPWREQDGVSFSLPDSLIHAEVIPGEGETWFLLMNSTLAPISVAVNILQVQLIWISLLLVLFAIVSSYFIADRLSRPLRRITTSAKKLAQGDFSGNFDGSGYHETVELAETLNYASRELGKSEKLQHEILANISHDLRTPLTMIGGYAEMMRDFPDSDYRESLDVIIDETQRLTRLITDVLDFSRMSAGVQELSLGVFNLSESLRMLIHNYNLLNEPNGYRFELIVDEDVSLVGDKTRIEQAVGNMLNNALTHCGEDKLILVEQKTSEEWVQVTITDHGKGIASEDLPYIWKRYYHADAPHRAGKGSGLGLSIVKGIMDLHQAKYGVESQLGQGCKFWFALNRNFIGKEK